MARTRTTAPARPLSVLVTGASSGIGAATVQRLARHGHRVFAGVRSDADGARVVAAAGPVDRARVEPLLLDVTDAAHVAAAAATVADRVGGGGLDGVVNNAGVAVGGPLEFLALDDWRAQFEVNVIGAVAVTRALLAQVRAARGRVVFVGSISGRVSTVMMGPYCASKHAVDAVAGALREEVRPFGVHVALVEPGAVRTEIWAKGRATADRLDATLGTEALALYGGTLDGIRRQLDDAEGSGVPADRVARVIEQALTVARPRHRYLVGPDAWGAGILDRLLPDRTLAALARRLGP